jgi:hypothetical protein
LPIISELEHVATTTPPLDPFTPLATTTTMDPFSFVANGTLGVPFQPTKPNTIMSIAFAHASNPPNSPFQLNVIIANPFALASIVKLISNPFSFGVQVSNVSFNTIGVLAFDLPTTSAPPSGYPNIFALNTTNGSMQWATTLVGL